MHDLILFRQLRDQKFFPEEVLEPLEEVASWPVHERLPFLGFVPKLFSHPDERVKAAACKVLGELQGVPAFRNLVAALNDPSALVRLAAVNALRKCWLGNDFSRWIHCLFHPRVDVRRAAIDDRHEFPAPHWWRLYLLADPECRELVLKQFNTSQLVPESIWLLFGYLRTGVLSRETTRDWVATLSWIACYGHLARSRIRSEEETAQVLQTAWSSTGPEPLYPLVGQDGLDELLALFVDAPDATRDWFVAFRNDLLTYYEETRKKVIASLVVSGLARAREAIESGSRHWLQVLVCFWPQLVEVKWLPLNLRRQALQGLYDLGQRAVRFDANVVRLLLQTEICQNEDGLLDLWSVGALLHLFETTPYKQLLKCYSLDLIRRSFEADPERAVAFLSLNDASKQGRKFFISELCLQSREKRSRLLALLCKVVPADGLDFLDSIAAEEAGRILEELVALKCHYPEGKRARLAEIFSRKMAASHLGVFLKIWVAENTPADEPLCLNLFGFLCREQNAKLLENAVRTLPVPELLRFLARATNAPGFPYDRELGIARLLADHAEEAVRNWAQARIQQHERSLKPAAPEVNRDALLKAGLCHQLRDQQGLTLPGVSICAALLASHDLLEEVDQQFSIYSSLDDKFVKKLDQEMVAHWRNETRLPLLGQAFMYRWEPNAYRFGELVETQYGFVGVLRLAKRLGSRLLSVRIWEAVNRVLELYHWHQKMKFIWVWKRELVDEIISNFTDMTVGPVAARLLMLRRGYHLNHPLWDELKPLVVPMLLSCCKEVLETLQPWIDSRGLIDAAPVAAATTSGVSLEAQFENASLETLRDAARETDWSRAETAINRLRAAGEAGHLLLRELLEAIEPIPHYHAIMHFVKEIYPDLTPLRSWLEDESRPVEFRFRLARRLIYSGKSGLYPTLLRLACLPTKTGWFEIDDYQFIRSGELIVGKREMTFALCESPHAHAYEPSLRSLCDDYPFDESIAEKLLKFLDQGTTRFRELRIQVAEKLYQNGKVAEVFPILFQRSPENPPPYPNLLKDQPREVLEAVVQGLLSLGWGETSEWMILHLLSDPSVREYYRTEFLTRLLREATNDSVRQEIRRVLKPSFSRDLKLRRIADTFAWGIRIGRQLTGKLFSIEMLTGEALGYTRFTESKIYINPLPILRGEMHGREVVRALILHEYGHHLYHKSEVGLQTWKQSEQEGLQRLLNLVSDEHLERNLRSQDRNFGDQLKLLASYAFQHTARQIPVENLLNALQHHAFEVLSSAPLEVAKKWACVTILNGRIMIQMEKAGLSFARFVRALRMGLGNRHDDPKVEEGLALFKDRFRKSDMPKLYEITKELRRIFGAETDILNSFDQDACCEGDGDEVQRSGEGITNEELQEEVKKSLEGRRKTPRDSKGGKGLNLGAEETFDVINEVLPMQHSPSAHGSYAQQVQRSAMLLRRFLKQLGIGYEQQRLRMSGRMFDKTRARAVVLRSDPRMLIARQLKIVTDLFIGVVIDCSGSMANADNIEKAKLFGTLIAEAAKNYPGIDVRLFGFTDRQIYDCGTANRCAVHNLEAGGGNNDAAGLWHAALAAKASQRKAKLLVMISDGSPTECTVTALRGLVQRLTKRMKICCAQVAVCPLEHICFPHYILLDQANVDLSVRQFGNTMMKLVQQALRG